MKIEPRSTIGTPEPPSSRPKLLHVKVLLAHEVGVGLPKTTRYRLADPGVVLADARAAAQYGIGAGKTWEYNYMIGLDGTIFTQAGWYRAAHCLNYNEESAGVLFLNALDVQVNEVQIEAWHELREYMVFTEILAPDYLAEPHYRYRDTSCCGIRAEKPTTRWPSPTGQGQRGDLLPALLNPPPKPPPPPIQVKEGTMLYIALPKYPGANANSEWWCIFESGAVRRAVNSDVTYAGRAGIAQIDQNSKEHDDYLRSIAIKP